MPTRTNGQEPEALHQGPYGHSLSKLCCQRQCIHSGLHCCCCPKAPALHQTAAHPHHATLLLAAPKAPCLTSCMPSQAQSTRTNGQEPDVHIYTTPILHIPSYMPSQQLLSLHPTLHAPMLFIIMYPGSPVFHEGAESQFQISLESIQCTTIKVLFNMLMFHVGHMEQPLCPSAPQHWSLQICNGECGLCAS